MKTITALQLRKDMNKYIKRASKGEYLRVTYRNTNSIIIGPEIESKESNADAFFTSAKEFSSKLSPHMRHLTDKDIQKIKNDHIKEKYGI
jgi:antitoxin (DNA-binding transcriptional repressor) of toxin-antitoxin stability system